MLSRSVAAAVGGRAVVTGRRNFAVVAEPPQNLPQAARVVICGGGALGNSVAYHLVESGWSDVIVLEKSKIGSGSSWWGSGTLGHFRTFSEYRLIKYSASLYKEIQDAGIDLGYRQCGSLNVARTPDRLISFRRRLAYTKPAGLQCELLSRKDLKERFPYVMADDLEGGVWVPEDAIVHPQRVTQALCMLSQKKGARYFESCAISKVLTDNGHVSGVELDTGVVVKCEYFVNCAGMWAHELGRRSEPMVAIPVHAAEHFYVTTVEIPDMPKNFPTVRDYDGNCYIRDWNGNFLVGGFEPIAKPAFHTNIPADWFKEITTDWEHFKPIMEEARHRLPIMCEANIKHFVNGPDNFSPDGRWILGEAPEVQNYYICVGMNGNSVQGSGGMGQALAEWIINGEPMSGNLLAFDITRFLDLHNNKRYLRERIREVVGRHYKILYPLQSDYRFARKLRCSPLYSEQETRGAVFGTKMGFERPLYFDTQRIDEMSYRAAPFQGTFGMPPFFPILQEEYAACKEGVAIIDMSSFSKFKLRSAGNEVVEYLQRLCSNDIDVPEGNIVWTGMQNDRGGYENDCMMLRMAKNSFFMVCPTTLQTRIMAWMRSHLPKDNSVVVRDATSMYAVLNVVGPKSRELLQEITGLDCKMEAFTAQEVDVGYVSNVLMMAFTNTGEPGFSLYIPSEYALHVYLRCLQVGRDYGLRNVGYYTLRFLRIEKFIPFWAEDLDSLTTPYEVGRGYKVKMDKEYFIGKTALAAQLQEGVKKKLVQFVLDRTWDYKNNIWPWGGEPIYRNGEYVGNVSSSGWGFTLKRMVCLGFVRRPDGQAITSDWVTHRNVYYELDIAGKRVPVHASLSPPAIKPTSFDFTYRPQARKSDSKTTIAKRV